MGRVQATLSVAVAVFAFDSDPATSPRRALQLLTVRKRLLHEDLEVNERFVDAATRVVKGSGVRGDAQLRLVGHDDAPSRNRSMVAWYYTTAHFARPSKPCQWVAAVRSTRLEPGDTPQFKASLELLRREARNVAVSAALLGDAFTADDLLNLHMALHGGTEGSERTFRRRVQQLRAAGVLTRVSDSDTTDLRANNPRFASQVGIGGRPPELLRYSGSGGEDEQLVGLRSHKVSS